MTCMFDFLRTKQYVNGSKIDYLAPNAYCLYVKPPMHAAQSRSKIASPSDDDPYAALSREKLNSEEINAIKEFTHTPRPFSFPVLGSYPMTLKYRNLEKISSYIVCRLHHGQAKLLLTETAHLSKYGHLSDIIVYAGAAPGTHILDLMELFPRHKFILWDPIRFDHRLEKLQSDRLELHNEHFTDDSALLYAGQNVLFISDIRSEVKGFEAFEEGVHKNNVDQRRWIQIMNPVISSLKFRIPFTHKGPYLYLDGIVYMQPFAPEHSAETRLVTDGKSERAYDPAEFENEMFYYNNVVREFGYYPHEIDPDLVEGLCYCHDCCYEVHIWKKYLKIDGEMPVEAIKCIADLMCKVRATTGKSLLTANHGVMPTVPMIQKRKHFKSAQAKKTYKKTQKK